MCLGEDKPDAKKLVDAEVYTRIVSNETAWATEQLDGLELSR